MAEDLVPNELHMDLFGKKLHAAAAVVDGGDVGVGVDVLKEVESKPRVGSKAGEEGDHR